jgi:hypothetical protein
LLAQVGLLDPADLPVASVEQPRQLLGAVQERRGDARLGALAAAIDAERFAGFPSGRLFLDFTEQALAVALVNSYGVHDHSLGMYRGGLGPARLRRVKEFVHAKIEDE